MENQEGNVPEDSIERQNWSQEQPTPSDQINQPPKVSSSSSSSSKAGSPNHSPRKEQEDTGSNEICGGYTEKEIDQHLDLMINRFQPPPPHMRGPIQQLINKRRVTALVSGDYDAAEVQDKAHETFNMVVQMEQDRLNEDHRIDILFARWQQLQQEHAEISEKWDEKMKKYADDDQEKYDQLLLKQQEEQEAFTNRWKDPNNLRKFNKPSNRLTQLREQEKAMAVSKMYQKAKDMKMVADKLQKEETAAAQSKIAQAMQIEKQKMLERQEFDRKKHVEHREKELETMEIHRQRELFPVVNAMQQIKCKKGNTVNPKTSSLNTRSVDDTSTQTLSPRTATTYAHFRSEKRTVRLAVQPIDDSKQNKKNQRAQTQEYHRRPDQDQEQELKDEQNPENPQNEEGAEPQQNTGETPEAKPEENAAPSEEPKTENEGAVPGDPTQTEPINPEPTDNAQETSQDQKPAETFEVQDSQPKTEEQDQAVPPPDAPNSP